MLPDAGGHSQWDTDGDGYGNRCDADLDQSGFVSSFDLSIFRSRYRTTDPDADFNGDGVVDAGDLAIFHSAFMKVPGPSGLNGEAGPEPVYTIHNDHLGTPLAMTDALGALVWKATYDPFGKATVNEDVDGNGIKVVLNFRFPGQYYDGESGLHYNYQRYYDPSTGRYMTSDPIGLRGGANTYTYVDSNPLALIDPYGLLGYYPGPDGRRGGIPGYGLPGSNGFGLTIGSTTIGWDSNKSGTQWGQTTQISLGVGFSLTFNEPTGEGGQGCSTGHKKPRYPDNYSFGLGKYLGVTYNADNSVTFSLGLSIGLPAGVGWDVTPKHH